MNSIKIGQVVNIHGVKGEVKVYTYTDNIENISKHKEFFFDEKLENGKKVSFCRVHKNMLIVKFKDINSTSEATALRNSYLYIEKEDGKYLEDGTYYVDDLIGSQVIDNITGDIIGKLVYVMSTGANDVYEVQTKGNGNIYLPAISQVIKKVDIHSKKMYVEIMEGLI